MPRVLRSANTRHQLASKGERVLECHRRALRHARRSRMRGVADKDYALIDEAIQVYFLDPSDMHRITVLKLGEEMRHRVAEVAEKCT
jgi:hypothetical protein